MSMRIAKPMAVAALPVAVERFMGRRRGDGLSREIRNDRRGPFGDRRAHGHG